MHRYAMYFFILIVFSICPKHLGFLPVDNKLLTKASVTRIIEL